jgi:hypothetical protein
MLAVSKSGMNMRPLKKRAASMNMGAWLLPFGVVVLLLWGSFAFIDEQPANTGNDWINERGTERSVRIAHTVEEDYQVDDYEPEFIRAETDSEPAARDNCLKKFHPCPTRD